MTGVVIQEVSKGSMQFHQNPRYFTMIQEAQFKQEHMEQTSTEASQ